MPFAPPGPPPISLRAGIVIRKSCDVQSGLYSLGAPETAGKAEQETIPVFPRPAVSISGANLVVDFHGAMLEGTAPETEPDKRRGLGIRVSGVNITLKNARVRGYRVGLIAENCPGLKLINCDFSYNWKQHLRSTLEREDERDWQSFHHNEHGEWLRYGAGIYLQGCDRFEVKGSRVHGGQCGLLLTRCNHGRAWNNDFSFNSGLGIGMYRSSNNQIMHNRLDWNVRGFSYGVYNRGQDSAGILIFEQCNQNVFAYNSATHGGDGFFLWAGQSTMDSGEGGCNDNIVFGNDFSHAPANGIEATFSSNVFIGNIVLECWHGIWGGYSFNSKIIGNRFGFNGQAISIEHGQDNVVSLNRFTRDSSGIGIWQDPISDRNWGYPKHHDTSSHSYVIRNNRFADISGPAISLRNTTDALIDQNGFEQDSAGIVLKNSSHIVLGDNKFQTVVAPVRSDGEGSGNMLDVDPDLISNDPNSPAPSPSTMDVGGKPILAPPVSLEDYLERFAAANSGAYSQIIQDIRSKGQGAYDSDLIPPLKSGIMPYLAPNALRGQRYILVDEWGPYDFQRPILWPRGSSAAEPAHHQFEILGPPGKWSVVSTSGVTRMSSRLGAVPGELEADFPAGRVSIVLEYTGAATVDERGIGTPAGRAIRFGYSRAGG